MELLSDSSLTISGTLVACTLVWLIGQWFYRWFTSPLRKIPGPRGYPLVGNLWELRGNHDVATVFARWQREHGSIFKYFLPIYGHTVFVSDRALLKQIAITDSSFYGRFKSTAETEPPSLLFANHAEGARQRKIFNPKLAYFAIKTYFDLFNDTTLKLVHIWREGAYSSVDNFITEEISEWLKRLTMDIMCQSAFNYNPRCIEHKDGGEFQLIEILVSASGGSRRVQLEKVLPLLKWLPSKEREIFLEAKRKVSAKIMDRVNQRQKENLENGVSKHDDLFQVIIELYDTEQEPKRTVALCEQVIMFIGAGYETTSNTLAWILYFLAKHPEKQRKARQEIQEVINEKGSLKWEDLGRLKYVDDCIKETLRLQGPGLSFARNPERDVTVGPYKIPKGTQVICSISIMHHNEKYWSNPNDFIPERFESIAEKDDAFLYSYLPFSRGPRSCIGKKFAEVEMKVVVSQVLYNFDLSLPSGHPDVRGRLRGFVYGPKTSPLLELRPRKIPCEDTLA